MQEELDERVVKAIIAENTGNVYHRRGAITDRALEAKIQAALVPAKKCPVSLCRHLVNHSGPHHLV